MKITYNPWGQYSGSPEAFMAHVKYQLVLNEISQRQLALAGGIDPKHMSRWITGKVRPSLASVMRIDAALNAVLYG